MRRSFVTMAIAALLASAPACALANTTHHDTGKPMSMVHRINLNTASRVQLEKLHGVNRADADRIVSDRPWHDAHDLVAKGILTQKQYDKDRHEISTSEPSHHHHKTSENRG